MAEAVQLNIPRRATETVEVFKQKAPYDENFFDKNGIGVSFSSAETLTGEEEDGDIDVEERKVLDHVADDLARLGRAKRVGLGVKDKINFVKMWTKTRRIW